MPGIDLTSYPRRDEADEFVCAEVSPGAETGARAIADLAGSENIQSVGLAETVEYRPKAFS